MYPPAPGREITPDIARELDDTYLSSDPFGYFRSRIVALARSADQAVAGSSPYGGVIVGGVHAFLQRPVLDVAVDSGVVLSQVAADAFSLRHHVAEALCRLASVALLPDPPFCAWSAVATGPVQMKSLLRDLKRLDDEDPGGEVLWRALVPPGVTDDELPERVLDAANVFGSWLKFATNLLIPGEIDLYAAHNKVKHGLSVRARHDLRGTLTLRPPNPDGNVPLSAFDPAYSVDLFKHPVLEFLAQAPETGGQKQGLEVTQLSLNTSALLAQAYMLAWTHGAVFSVLAHRHFAGRDEYLTDHVGPPEFPGFPWGGPRPEHIAADDLIGWRFPITKPPGGGETARKCGVAFPKHFLEMRVDWDNVNRGQIVDDEP